MKKIFLTFGILFCAHLAFAQMPMDPAQGKFSFHGESHITSKVHSIYFGAQTENLETKVAKYTGQGYTCSALENDDYECAKDEAVTSADQAWIEKAKADEKDHWLKFANPTEPPVLEHVNGDASVWTVTQDVMLSNGDTASEMEYSFAGKDWKNISFFDSIAMEQNDFQIVSKSRLTKALTYDQDENDGTHLEVVVNCVFDSE